MDYPEGRRIVGNPMNITPSQRYSSSVPYHITPAEWQEMIRDVPPCLHLELEVDHPTNTYRFTAELWIDARQAMRSEYWLGAPPNVSPASFKERLTRLIAETVRVADTHLAKPLQVSESVRKALAGKLMKVAIDVEKATASHATYVPSALEAINAALDVLGRPE